MSLSSEKSTAIIYSAFINPKANWRKLIELQLQDVKKSGVLEAADLHVIVTNHSDEEGVAEFFNNLEIEIANLQIHDTNTFEYYAIKYLWDLAHTRSQYQNAAYFHTKSISFSTNKRNNTEEALTHYTFKNWNSTLQRLCNEKEIHKIGLFPSPPSENCSGVMWFNFWWTKLSYIRTLPDPILTQDRFYYEHWIGMTSLPHNPTGYSFCLLTHRNDYFERERGPELIQIIRRNRRFPLLGNFMHYLNVLFGAKKLI